MDERQAYGQLGEVIGDQRVISVRRDGWMDGWMGGSLNG